MTAPDCPLVTVDAACFDNMGRLLVIERLNEPFMEQRALPGGFVDKGKETIEQAVIRELLEETRLRLTEGELHLFKVYSEPTRDPRGHVISLAFTGILNNPGFIEAGDDAAKVEWINDWRITPLAFDHGQIAKDAWTMLASSRIPGPRTEPLLDPKMLQLTPNQRATLMRVYRGDPLEWHANYPTLLKRGLMMSMLSSTGRVIFQVTTRGIAALT